MNLPLSMRSWPPTFCPFVLCLLLAVNATRAQEDTGGGESQPAIASPAKAEFQTRFVALKEAMKQIDLLRIEYQTADDARRQELQQNLKQQYEAAKAMLPGVVDSALTAFDAAGGEDEEIETFLMTVAGMAIATDQYEQAHRVIQSLTEAGVEHPGLSLRGVLAAFAVADYDAAARHLEKVEQSGMLSQSARAQNPQEVELVNLVTSLAGLLDSHQQAWAEEQQIRAAEAAADDLPRVLLRTTQGDITLELFENEAPNTVKNFVTLVEQGSYDGTAFHRVLPNFMAQGGDPTTGGKPAPNYTVPCECYEPNARKHFRGSLSMAHAGRDTGNAGFFLTFRPTPHLDGQTFYPGSPNAAHTVFGRVVDGLDVLAEIQRIDPTASPDVLAMQPPPDRIIEAKVLRKRPGTDYGDFEKLAR